MLRNKSLIRIIKLIIPILLLTIIYVEGRKELKELDASNLFLQIKSLTPNQLIFMFLSGMIAVSAMIFYDVILVKKLNITIKWTALVKISWISNTFNNVLGFGGFAGASIRGLLLKKYTGDSKELWTSILWITPFILTGLSVLAWFPLFSFVDIQPVLDNHQWLILALWGMAGFLPVYSLFLIYTRRKKGEPLWNHWTTWAIVVSIIEWFIAAVFMWGITVVLGNDLPFHFILSTFIAAAIAGVISLVPGGLGSFDLMILIGLKYYGVEDGQVLIILLFYRLFYFFIPFIIGLIFASTEVIVQTKNAVVQTKLGKWLKKYALIPDYLVPNISHWAMAALVFVSGILLLLSAATPAILDRVTFAEKLFSAPILNMSFQLSVTAGISLLLLSRSIQLKVKSAYTLSYIVLIAGAVFTFSKGFDFEEALFLFGIAALLRISKKQFYRESLSLSCGAFMTMAALTIGSLVTYVFIGYLDHPYEKLKLPEDFERLLVKEPYELLISAIIGLILAIIFNFVGFKLLATNTSPPVRNIDIIDFLVEHKGNVLTHLSFLNDKEFFWTKDEDVLFMYSTMADKLVVLGDPIGDSHSFSRAIDELHQFADVKGLKCVFYQIQKNLLPLYHENGYHFFKLGEEAYVDLEEFTLVGKKKTSLRTVKNKFEREGYKFAIHSPPYNDKFIAELKDVSDEWLGKRKEKGFSLGFFDKHYLQQGPIATLTNTEGQVIAFANLMPVYDNNEVLSVDLMRHLRNVPNGTMDMLFISILEYAKESGYKSFNLGMAPLSNVGMNKYSFLDEKVAAKIYRHGHYLYQFDGIRKYKEKFATRWEPKYLAFRGRQSLPVTIFQLSLLIGKKRK
ncbi:bifunctional lysylphosphatidylglycerol flippase/synthetase MprF [Bacillus sp. 31A1R]|uniref:Phosphatidylglycerol lysyltransferase n=1 Tax=Robertmurraya mangrovi TaxID=3098077 RepID=A0ABU5IZT2_9BACI|nr:bifunctional lysylphosphatidylglycerol flippase/synthetase MprF [Bacillus sp. 31A1R]MDZ5472669.1 bifunctional lysylphosphatidylglycerol flippase/synthetase MprF [Bacillus sp. 31A1R]